MPSLKKLIDSYQLIQGRIKETQDKMIGLRAEEKEINEEIKNYLQTSGEEGIRIDKDTVINLTDVDKKINLPANKYKQKIKDLLVEKGKYVSGLEEEIILAKVEGRVKEQRLKINRKKIGSLKK